jgi:hypothetical protein
LTSENRTIKQASKKIGIVDSHLFDIPLDIQPSARYNQQTFSEPSLQKARIILSPAPHRAILIKTTSGAVRQ